MAILYKTDGTSIEITTDNGSDFILEELQRYVGGLIEIVYLNNKEDQIMVINEEGKLLDLPINISATRIFRESYHKTTDYIVGDVIVCGNCEVK